MPTKMLNPNTTIWFVPKAGIVDPYAPTATEINAGLNISCAITRGYTLNPTDSDTDDTASICDTGNVETRLYDNYEAELTFFRDSDASDAVSVYNIAFTAFKAPDVEGWLIRRLGKKSTVAAIAADEVELFLVANDRARTVDGGDAGPIQFTVPFLAQGTYTGYVDVVVPPI